ncbi:MAG: hypothetical protein ACXVX5_01205 [Mycobacterium sp.]
MHHDRFGRTPDEIEDEARHSYAEGTVVLRAIADELSKIALNGDTINRWKLKHLHDQLYKVYELLGSHTVFGMGDEPATDAELAAVDAYRDTYSDGTPVAIVAGPLNSRGWSAPRSVHDCDIPWLPNTTSNDGYAPDGPIPPGCEVMVVAPPSRRRRERTTGRKARTQRRP